MFRANFHYIVIIILLFASYTNHIFVALWLFVAFFIVLNSQVEGAFAFFLIGQPFIGIIEKYYDLDLPVLIISTVTSIFLALFWDRKNLYLRITLFVILTPFLLDIYVSRVSDASWLSQRFIMIFVQLVGMSIVLGSTFQSILHPKRLLDSFFVLGSSALLLTLITQEQLFLRSGQNMVIDIGRVGAMSFLVFFVVMLGFNRDLKLGLKMYTIFLFFVSIITLTRQGIFAAITSIFVDSTVNKRLWILIKKTFGFILFGLFALYSIYTSVDLAGLDRFVNSQYGSRDTDLLKAWNLFLQNPIFGNGFGSFGLITAQGYYPHNFIVEILAELGVLGMVLFLFPSFFLFYIYRGKKKWKANTRFLFPIGTFLFLVSLVSYSLPHSILNAFFLPIIIKSFLR